MRDQKNDSALVERIQAYLPAGVLCTSAHNLPVRGKGDEAIFPFAYRTNACDYELRGAFTSGDPCWEEDDYEAFAEMLGE